MTAPASLLCPHAGHFCGPPCTHSRCSPHDGHLSAPNVTPAPQDPQIAFASAIEKLGEDVEDQNRGGWRADYGSVLRDASAILTLATDAKAKPAIIRTAMSAIEVERARTRYTSTQEMSWMVLAARAVIEQSKTIALDVGGTVHNGSLNRMFRDGALEQDFRVTNKGDQPLRAVVAVSGSPLVAEPASSNGLTVERKYYTTAGDPVDIATVKQNTRLVAVLSVMKPNGQSENGTFLLVDPLPAGFEIENPRLAKDPPSVKTGDGVTPAYTDIRDDRIVLAFGRLEPGTYHYYYVVRAVTPGVYQYPAAAAECMYDAQIHGASVPSMVTVTAVN